MLGAATGELLGLHLGEWRRCVLLAQLRVHVVQRRHANRNVVSLVGGGGRRGCVVPQRSSGSLCEVDQSLRGRAVPHHELRGQILHRARLGVVGRVQQRLGSRLGLGQCALHLVQEEETATGEDARVILGEAPDPVSVKFEGPPDLLDEDARVLDDVGAGLGHHTGHLDRVPASSTTHHITVETVQDTLVRKLKTLVEENFVLCGWGRT